MDWTAIATWIGAGATVGLVIAAFRGLYTWRTQFLKQRDHDLALRIVKAISNSYIVFDELRSPVQLFSDSDVPVPPPEGDSPDPYYDHRRMFARYKARTIHLSDVRAERTTLLLEALAIWDEGDYATTLGELTNRLADVEQKVIVEATEYVESLKPNYEAGENQVSQSILFSPADAAADDPTGAEYEGIRDEILNHLKPKIRME
jgi:hypothetical protein